LAFASFVRPRSSPSGLFKGVFAAFVLVVAIVTVGLTASTESPFSIVIHPVFLRLGVDVDVKIGSLHLHGSWSALPDGSTKGAGDTI